ncbi:MAG: flavodoxin family protein [Bacillota bacterium]
MIKVVGIKGSPRNNSNSNFMLDEMVSAIEDATSQQVSTNLFSPAKLDLAPCQGCFYCDQSGECIIKDDMQNLYQEFNQADIILLATPIFFNGVSAQLKTMIDRCQAIWGSKYKAKDPIIDRHKDRYGFLLAAGGAPEYDGQFIAAKKVTEMLFRVTNTDWQGEIKISNSDEEPVNERSDILEQIDKAGAKLADQV